MRAGRKTHLPDQSCRITVHVIPRSSKTSIEEIGTSEYKVRIHTPPVEGKANRGLVRLFSEALGISKEQIRIVSGLKSRIKIIEIHGLSFPEVSENLKTAKA